MVLPKAFLLDARRRLVGTTLSYAPALAGNVSKFRRLSEWAILLEGAKTRDGMPGLGRFEVTDVVIGPEEDEFDLEGLMGARLRRPYFIVQSAGSSDQLALQARGWALTGQDMQQFSRWPATIQAAIRERRLIIGMTPAQVVVSVGVPDKRERIADEKGVTEEWQYGRKRVSRRVYFSGHRLTRIHESQ
jgi:hypothetical protein